MAWLRVPQPACAGNKKTPVPPTRKNAPRRATCPAEGKEFLPMIAVHITNKAGYDAIVKAREIRPRGRKRRHGESDGDLRPTISPGMRDMCF